MEPTIDPGWTVLTLSDAPPRFTASDRLRDQLLTAVQISLRPGFDPGTLALFLDRVSRSRCVTKIALCGSLPSDLAEATYAMLELGEVPAGAEAHRSLSEALGFDLDIAAAAAAAAVSVSVSGSGSSAPRSAPHARALHLSGLGVKAAHLRKVAGFVRARLQGLVTLDLSHNYLGPDGGREVGAFIADCSIRKLDIDACKVGPVGAAAIAAGLAQNCSLSMLSMFHNGIQGVGFSAIVEAAAQRVSEGAPRLDLRVGSNGVGSRFATTTTTTTTMSSSSSSASSSSSTTSSTPAPPNLAECIARALSSLSIESNGLGPAGAGVLGAALNLPGCALTSLDLSWNGIGDHGARGLTECLIARAARSAETNTAIASARSAASRRAAVAARPAVLRVLRVRNNTLTFTVSSALLDACARAGVAEVDLSNNIMGPANDPASCALIAGALGINGGPPGASGGITRLTLHSCAVDHDLAMSLASAIPGSRLTHLSITHGTIGAEAAAALFRAAVSDANPAPAMRSIAVRLDTTVGPEGAEAIAQVLSESAWDNATRAHGPCALESVSLDGIGARRRGGRALARIIGTRGCRLTSVSFRDDDIGEASIPGIAASLMSNPTLVSLDLRGNKMSPESLEGLSYACSVSPLVTVPFTPEQRLAFVLALHRRRVPVDIARMILARGAAQGQRQIAKQGSHPEIVTAPPRRLRVWRGALGNDNAVDMDVEEEGEARPRAKVQRCVTM